MYTRPILFLLYCADVTNIAVRHGVPRRLRTLMTLRSLYVILRTVQQRLVDRLTSCIEELDTIMDGVKLTAVEFG